VIIWLLIGLIIDWFIYKW